MTATFAADEFLLRDDWATREKRLREKRPVLDAVDGTSFLTAVTLLASYERHQANKDLPVACKRADVLRLSLASFKKYAPAVETGFRKAAELLAEQKIFDARSLPYATQLIPMAAICAAMGQQMDQHGNKQRLLRWYWCGVFGELYGSANETRFGLDLPGVAQWIAGGDEPRTVRDASFAPTRLLSLQSRLAAAYKGLAALLMQQGGRDFITGTPIDLHSYFERNIDIHHVFPRKWCEDAKLPREKWNSVVNKAPLSAETNRSIGGDAPTLYLKRIETAKMVDAAALDGFLATHCVPIPALRSDNFDAFIQQRARALLGLIEAATGKTVPGRDSEETIEACGASLAQ